MKKIVQFNLEDTDDKEGLLKYASSEVVKENKKLKKELERLSKDFEIQQADSSKFENRNDELEDALLNIEESIEESAKIFISFLSMSDTLNYAAESVEGMLSTYFPDNAPAKKRRAAKKRKVTLSKKKK